MQGQDEKTQNPTRELLNCFKWRIYFRHRFSLALEHILLQQCNMMLWSSLLQSIHMVLYTWHLSCTGMDYSSELLQWMNMEGQNDHRGLQTFEGKCNCHGCQYQYNSCTRGYARWKTLSSCRKKKKKGGRRGEKMWCLLGNQY